MSSTGTTLTQRKPRPYTHDRHLLISHLGEPIALTTCVAPPHACNAFYILGKADDWGDVQVKQIDDIAKDTLLAFDSVPELMPYGKDGRVVDITPLVSNISDDQCKLFNFGI